MSIRLRLVFLALIAGISTVVATWLGFGNLQAENRALEQKVVHNRWAQDCSTLIHFIQRERGASTSFIAASQHDRGTIKKMRADSNAALAKLFENPMATKTRLDRVGLADFPVKLMEIRNQADINNMSWRVVRDSYTSSINTLLGAIEYQLLTDAEMFSPDFDAIAELAIARESLGLLRATVNSIKDQTPRNTNDLIFLASELTLYKHHIDMFNQVGEPGTVNRLQSIVNNDDYRWTFAVINQILSNSDTPAWRSEERAWWERSTHVIDAQKALEDQLFSELDQHLTARVSWQKQYMLGMAVGTAALLLILAIFVWLTTVRMMRDLKQLSVALDEIVEKENYTIRLKAQGKDDEFSHAFRMFNRLLEFTEHLIRQKENLASMDTLTGVMNRRSLLKYAQREIARAARHSQSLCLIFLDIDHFKQVNDKYGHQTGDEALKTFVNIIKARARNTDLLSRWGGEEFIILAPDTVIDAATIYAESLRKTIAGAEFPGVGQVTCSLGVAQWQPGESFESLCSRADMALYQAKKHGRNQVSRADEHVYQEQEWL